jgi:hypothetical protein
MSILNIGLTTDAGVTRSIMTGASPLRISDNETSATIKNPLTSEPVSTHAVRTKNRVSNIAGVLKAKVDSNKSIAYGDRAFSGKL